MQVLERYQYFCVMNRSKYTMDLTMPVIIYFLSLFILLVFLCCLRISYKYIQVSASSSKELTSFIVNHYRWNSMIEVPVRDLTEYIRNIFYFIGSASASLASKKRSKRETIYQDDSMLVLKSISQVSLKK